MEKKTLYKLTSVGKKQFWTIWTEGADICTEYGQVDGKKLTTKDTIKVGKNIGTKAETTPEEQAEKEAQSKYDKKRRKEYRESLDDIGKLGDVKESSEGGYLPMLAKKYDPDKWEYPCMGQPKLDGLRCISKKNSGKVTLWFRSGKPIATMPHIAEELNRMMINGEIWDGELYSHSVDFSKIMGAIRRDKHIRIEDQLLIQYHIYDWPRIGELKEKDSFASKVPIFFDRVHNGPVILKYLKAVPTEHIVDEEQMKEMHHEFIQDGYEGIMLRGIDMPYEQKRSKWLVKYKEFDEKEFKIVGYEEGRGQLQGCVGSFICEFDNKVDPKDDTFSVKLKGEGVTDLLKEYYENTELFMYKHITVKFQGYGELGKPRFPVGKVIRFDK